MRSLTWLRARPRALASAGVVTAASVALATLAVAYQGFPTTEVDLHDGGVWVTKQSSLLVGHFNHESQVLDGGLRTTAEDFDVLQAGSTVLVVDSHGGTLAPVDPAMVSLTQEAEIPTGAEVALGGGTVAVLDPASGSLWVLAAAAVGSFHASAVEPAAELGAHAAVAVGVDGVVHAVAPERAELVSIALGPDGTPGTPAHSTLAALADETDAAVTAVGAVPVVLLPVAGGVAIDGGDPVAIEHADQAVLQEPAGSADAVVLATNSSLVRVPLNGSPVSQTSSGAQGAAAAPVVVTGCAYGAWSGSAKLVRDCAGTADDLVADIDGVDEGAELRFRVNRDVVVLNDIVGGTAWLASESMQRVDNWNDITPPDGDTDSDDDSTEETTETTLPERSEINSAPVAVDDEFGVRAGRTAVLPLLDNDSDPDGDVLVISLPDGQPKLGLAQPITNGAALQIAVPVDATGTDTFRYQVDDGRGGTDTATVRLTVRDGDSNEPPTQNRVAQVLVEAGGTVSYNVLPDWRDPDGDDLILSYAEAAPGDSLEFTSDGRITYRAISGTQGTKEIPIVVSDGTKSSDGVLRIQVRPLGSTDPVTNADHVVLLAGQTVTVAPVANDTSSGSEPLRLVRVRDVAGGTIVPDYANRTFSFASDTAGVYYVQYEVASGARTAGNVVRIDVLAEADPDLPPIAVRDVALLPAGGEVLVNVLANDSDPAGGVLVVQSVAASPDSGIAAAVIGHETVRISNQSAMGGQVRVGYRISNGVLTAEGEIIVIPIPAPAKLRPPAANDDTAVVRAGDVVTIPVLANDTHPNDDTIHVVPDLVPPLITADQGEMFVSEDTLRFRASNTPGTVYATYEVVDSTGQRDSAYVTIQVLPVDPDTNTAPRPRELTARVLSGQTVSIPVPLDGIDPEGDSVELVGIASAPAKGRILETGANTLVYEAFGDASGLDTFTYRVRDALGKEATAQVRVGIAPAEATNHPPFAVKDSITIRPSRVVAVPVTLNDIDPDGDEIALVADSLVLQKVPGFTAEVQNGSIVVTSPDHALQTSLEYSIRDSRGAPATGVVLVTVADDVPLVRPVARDDRVRIADIEDGVAAIDLLANDSDADGTLAALDVAVDDKKATVSEGTLRIALTEDPQLLRYTITDRDGLSASAFVFVPGTTTLPPALKGTGPVEVRSGETIELPLADYVSAFDGGGVVITEAAKVFAAHSDGATLVKDQTTLVYTSADRYFGPDAITFEVTDGTGPDDAKGRKSTLTLPITVLPPENQQPAFVDGTLDIAPGEDAIGLDLKGLTTDPDPEDLPGMTYTIVGSLPTGITASIDGSQLRVNATASTPKGTGFTIPVRIDDGHTAPVDGSVNVRVVASTRMLATLGDDVIDEAHQGKTVTVKVLENDVNPFAAAGPLKVVSTTVDTGDGSATVKGDTVLVTPTETFSGTMVVRYRVQDATADTDREVDGYIRLTVQGRPDAPGTPRVTSVQDRTVVMSWDPPADNGAEIEYYTVRSLVGGYVKECPATTCTLDGLTNNVEYNFTVTATNRVNDSDPSMPSEPARPDARPDTPQAPSLVFGDKSLKVSWVTPSTPGSPVESFTLEISPAPASGPSQLTGVTGNTLTWSGLENGVNYQVRVRAHNRAIDPSSWSVYSAGAIPAAPPAAAAAPTTARLDPVPPQAQLQVSWAAPASNGDTIDQYRLNILKGGSLVRTVTGIAGGQTTQAVSIDASTSDYTFTVAAHNKAGWGADSAASSPRRAFIAPGAPTKVTATTPNNDKAIVVTYGAAAGNGATAGEIAYEYNVGGGWRSDWDGKKITAGLTPGTSYTVKVRAYTKLDGVRYDGAEASAASAAIPYGPINTPGASASRSGQSIVFQWSPPATNGRAITKLEIRFDSGGWESVSVASGSRTIGYGYSQTHSITVRATDAAGQTSTSNPASASTADPPPTVARTIQGDDSGFCTGDTCYYLGLYLENFPAGNYGIRCLDNGVQFGSIWTRSVPANGTVKFTDCWTGGAGHEIRIEIVGWGLAEPTSWP